ncbi:helix-turn-helix domain-containing protein [Tepidimonas taiwanensis]|uniref:helix-turn-helix domain-containing protein n=1 Tax=Tepidimonas taiwanensis TaxID=307486 RepID=UPI0012E02617|nr:helix-turn-helix transcriptional regulator [Tepidimonas taiwanensis]
MENIDRGMRIKEERERLGLSQVAFAARAGASKGSQILYEKGKPPTAEYLEGIAAIGADVLYILTGRRERPALEDHERLVAAIAFVESELAAVGRQLPPEKKAEAIALAFELLKGDDHGREQVRRMLRLVA